MTSDNKVEREKARVGEKRELKSEVQGENWSSGKRKVEALPERCPLSRRFRIDLGESREDRTLRKKDPKEASGKGKEKMEEPKVVKKWVEKPGKDKKKKGNCFSSTKGKYAC